jgi:hypothetical protein
MSKENVVLLGLAVLLCCLNFVFGPLAQSIARFFSRVSRAPATQDKGKAGERAPSGPGGLPPAVGEAAVSRGASPLPSNGIQISK